MNKRTQLTRTNFMAWCGDAAQHPVQRGRGKGREGREIVPLGPKQTLGEHELTYGTGLAHRIVHAVKATELCEGLVAVHHGRHIRCLH